MLSFKAEETLGSGEEMAGQRLGGGEGFVFTEHSLTEAYHNLPSKPHASGTPPPQGRPESLLG